MDTADQSGRSLLLAPLGGFAQSRCRGGVNGKRIASQYDAVHGLRLADRHEAVQHIRAYGLGIALHGRVVPTSTRQPQCEAVVLADFDGRQRSGELLAVDLDPAGPAGPALVETEGPAAQVAGAVGDGERSFDEPEPRRR